MPGASGFQVVPAIAPETEHLTVFQRTAQWMFPNPHYHESVGEGVQWALRHLPFYGRWYRFLLFWPGCDGALDVVRVDPDFEPAPGAPPAVSEMNDGARAMFTEWITEQVGDDPDLLAKCIPDYPAMGKRVLQDNGSWLQALRRDDVDLVRTDIERITPERGARRRRRPPRGRRRSCSPRASTPRSSCGPSTSWAGTARRWPSTGTSGPRPTSASPYRGSPTCSACTARAPTWPTAAA